MVYDQSMTCSKDPGKSPNLPKEVKLPCGCIYKDQGWMLMRVTECELHHRRRTTKRPYRPKAECVRP